MIFVALGTQKFQMNRLISAIDFQKKEGLIKDEVFAQIGKTEYIPEMFEYKDFLNGTEFSENIEKADIIITHSGVSTIIKSLMLGKKVIVVPRMAKYGEHVDDHQMEIALSFSKMNHVLICLETDNINELINEARTHSFAPYISGNQVMIDTINDFLSNGSKK